MEHNNNGGDLDLIAHRESRIGSSQLVTGKVIALRPMTIVAIAA